MTKQRWGEQRMSYRTAKKQFAVPKTVIAWHKVDPYVGSGTNRDNLSNPLKRD